MHIDYIAQPDNQLGTALSNMLDAHPPASSIVFVSAFVSVQAVMRVKRQIAEPDAEYECVLARQQTLEYRDWIKACTQPVRSSTRCFGYA